MPNRSQSKDFSAEAGSIEGMAPRDGVRRIGGHQTGSNRRAKEISTSIEDGRRIKKMQLRGFIDKDSSSRGDEETIPIDEIIFRD